MALTQLQKDVMAVIAANRSESSYMAGGAVLNKDWFRLSDDLDIFHDTDEEVVATAKTDIAGLEEAGSRSPPISLSMVSWSTRCRGTGWAQCFSG